MRVSHGCVRLYPEDIARLFPRVPKGTRVTIVNQPYVAGWRGGQLYLEAHQPLIEDARRWGKSLQPMEQAIAARTAGPDIVNWDKARKAALEARGIPIPVSPDSPDLEDVLTAAPLVPSNPPWALADDSEG
jgi:L,D-transpeptidase ErfK/SrfK